MTVICDLCHEEKAKSQMRTAGVNGGPAVCKACHRSAHDLDEFGTLRLCAMAIDKHDAVVRHRIVKALMHRVEL